MYEKEKKGGIKGTSHVLAFNNKAHEQSLKPEMKMVHPHGAADCAATMLSLTQNTTPEHATNKRDHFTALSTQLAPSACGTIFTCIYSRLNHTHRKTYSIHWAAALLLVKRRASRAVNPKRWAPNEHGITTAVKQ